MRLYEFIYLPFRIPEELDYLALLVVVNFGFSYLKLFLRVLFLGEEHSALRRCQQVQLCSLSLSGSNFVGT